MKKTSSKVTFNLLKNGLIVAVLFATTFSANLLAQEFSLTVKANEGGTAIGFAVADTLTYAEAFPNAGYLFLYWTDNTDKVISEQNPYYFNLVSDTELFANFTKKDYFTVTTISTHYSGGIVEGAGDFKEGETAKLTVTPNVADCYKFLHWSDSEGNVISEKHLLEFVVVSDITVFANFEDLSYFVWVSADNGGWVYTDTIRGCDEEPVIVEAFASEGYKFLHWSNGVGDVISTENPYSVIGDGTVLVANFVEETSNIATSIASSTVSISPNPTVSDVTVSFDLVSSGNLTVTLSNLLGQELFEIHNDFTNAGPFSKTFSINTLPKGMYYLNIIHNGTVKVEKVIKQ